MNQTMHTYMHNISKLILYDSLVTHILSKINRIVSSSRLVKLSPPERIAA